MHGTTARTLLAALAAAASLGAAGACGKVEGQRHWQEEARLHQGDPAHPGATEEVYAVPRPPFSPGIFPCSRCHEGSEAAARKDERPAMPHAFHLTRGLECADCHMPDDAPEPKVPAARAACDDCHGDPAKLTAGAKAYFDALTAADGTFAFPRRWATRDVDPKHAAHAKAGVACVACHGEPREGAFAKPQPLTLMARCVACHEERKAPVLCETCHRDTKGKAHANVVLDHAEDQRGCLDCHDAEDRDRLRLANGTIIPFEESYRLCGQCHGTQFRDWKIGLHGKRTGEWSGRREYRLCVHCHWPHAPKFQPMAPVAPPARPEEIR